MSQFRFNVREVEMGTRRPLIVQMVHDPTAQEPRCRLQEEDSDEYGEIRVEEHGQNYTLSPRTAKRVNTLSTVCPVSQPNLTRAWK